MSSPVARSEVFADRSLFGHPRGLGLLFVTEMWERFSYYGMRALLVLYLVNAQHWTAARAATLYRQGCEQGVAAGCSNLGQLTDRGDGVAKDAAAAARLYQRGCDADSPLGCNDLGLDYKDGVGTPNDDARAAQLFARACDLGHADGCTNLGFMRSTGRGVPL